MLNIQNKITHIVNFIKRKYKKRICNYTHYTHRGYLKLNRNQFHITLLPEIFIQKIFKQNEM